MKSILLWKWDFQSQRSINHARMDTASGTTFVETTSPSTEAEVLAEKLQTHQKLHQQTQPKKIKKEF